MKLGFLAAFTTLCAASALAAPPPPLPPEETAFYDSFFTAFPSVFPVKDIANFRRLVSKDVQVFEHGKLVHRSRDGWLKWLQQLGGHANGVRRFSMSREEFFFAPSDRIMVHEFWMPIADGVVWHPEYPHRMVSYQFKDRKLVRVDYIGEFRPTERKFGEARP